MPQVLIIVDSKQRYVLITVYQSAIKYPTKQLTHTRISTRQVSFTSNLKIYSAQFY